MWWLTFQPLQMTLRFAQRRLQIAQLGRKDGLQIGVFGRIIIQLAHLFAFILRFFQLFTDNMAPTERNVGGGNIPL